MINKIFWPHRGPYQLEKDTHEYVGKIAQFVWLFLTDKGLCEVEISFFHTYFFSAGITVEP
jgi:hypothetical protein